MIILVFKSMLKDNIMLCFSYVVRKPDPFRFTSNYKSYGKCHLIQLKVNR